MIIEEYILLVFSLRNDTKIYNRKFMNLNWNTDSGLSEVEVSGSFSFSNFSEITARTEF